MGPKIKDFSDKILAFEDSFNELQEAFGLQITNKIHIIISHLGDYLARNGMTLLETSDQGVEASNKCFDKFINTHGYFRKHNQTEDQGIMLLRGVLAYNSYHIGSK